VPPRASETITDFQVANTATDVRVDRCVRIQWLPRISREDSPCHDANPPLHHPIAMCSPSSRPLRSASSSSAVATQRSAVLGGTEGTAGETMGAI
jgi:hypothetical protein